MYLDLESILGDVRLMSRANIILGYVVRIYSW